MDFDSVRDDICRVVREYGLYMSHCGFTLLCNECQFLVTLVAP